MSYQPTATSDATSPTRMYSPPPGLASGYSDPSMQSLTLETDRVDTPTTPMKYDSYNGLGGDTYNRKSGGSVPMLLKEEANFSGSQNNLEGGGGTRNRVMASGSPARKGRRRWVWIVVAAVVIIAVAVPIGITQSNKSSSNKSSSSNSGGNGSGSNGGGGSTGPTGQGFAATNPGAVGGSWYGSGSDNTTMRDGATNATFVYSNPFGGKWNQIPFNDSARCQDDMPALNEKWDWNTHRIQGVNIGGWLTIEPFIVPSLFEPYLNDASPAVDEWTLSEKLGSQLAQTIENHYATFITEEDFAMIASAGLNWIRLPIPWWIIDTWEGEPFLEGVGWKYFLKGIEWARKYGLRICLDFHTAPGSQNGYNHSGKLGTINWLTGYMGIANAQRTLNYIRTLAEFISQPQYANVIQMFEILNEPKVDGYMGEPAIKAFYLEAYNMIRSITGIGEGNGAIIALHDGFPTAGEQAMWGGFLNDGTTGADRLFLDQHNYFCFDVPTIQANYSIGYAATLPCHYNAAFNTTAISFGPMFAGEWALAVNDCGEFVNNVGTGNRYEGTLTTSPSNRTGSCDFWNDYTQWDANTKQGFQKMALAQFDAFTHSFFWTWKIGNSTTTGKPSSPMWSYKLGLQAGYVPPNPRVAPGFCASYAPQEGVQIAPATPQWSGTYSAWMTGGSGAGTIPATATATFSVFPPPSLLSYPNAALLPTYTPTGSVITLQGATPTAFPTGVSTNPGNGWKDPSDTATGWYTINTGCSYANAWSANTIPQPATSACGGGNQNANTVFKRLTKPTAAPVLR